MTVHRLSDVQSTQIGASTQIWQYCVVLPGARIGSDCNICSHCFIENDVVLGNRVTVKCGVHLWDGVTLENDVFVGPNVTFTNDPFPRSKCHLEEFPRTLVKAGASIGANSTILPGITIGARSMIGAGAVVTSNVPPGAVVAGNPARIMRYSQTDEPASTKPGLASPQLNATDAQLLKWIQLADVEDIRGHLTVAQWNQHLPFEPKRVFFVHQVPSRKVRGEHAHKQCQQVLVCLSGSVHVVADDGHSREEYVLTCPDRALLIPAGIWATQYKYSHDAVMAVFASHDYDEDDYIRDYDDYVSYRQPLIA